MLIRAALTGSNGQHLMDFLMDEYVYDEKGAVEPHKLAYDAGARDLVLRLRRVATE